MERYSRGDFEKEYILSAKYQDLVIGIGTSDKIFDITWDSILDLVPILSGGMQ